MQSVQHTSGQCFASCSGFCTFAPAFRRPSGCGLGACQTSSIRSPQHLISANSKSKHASGQYLKANAGSSEPETTLDRREPEDVRGAIAIGLGLYEEGKYQEALDVFERGLELPGSGMKRFRDKPRAISDGEKQSILYNVACCYSRLEDARTGLVALAGCLESGYDDAAQLREDPDLEFLRKDSRFNGLLERFKLNAKKGFLEEFLKGFNL